MSSTLLLVSSDTVFSATVKSCLKNVTDLHIEVVPSFPKAIAHTGRSDVGLTMVQVQSNDQAAELAKQVQSMKDFASTVPVIAIIDENVSGQATLQLLRVGLMDCLTRPLDLNRLTFLVDSLTLRKRTELRAGEAAARSRKRPATELAAPADPNAFLYSSAPMQQLVSQVSQIANRRNAVVITGETGTGKTRLARFIHDSSVWKDGPFIHVDCGAVPENLIEGELFGYRKGAFTGASADYEGKCAAASNGTLFLDEIDALSPAMQSRLLRLTDEGVFSPIGVVRESRLNARILAGTNRNLSEEVAAGRFRQDLFFRLTVFELQVPPLRQRPQEIRPLTEHVMQTVAAAHGTGLPLVDPDVWQALESYDWPGNVRELRNSVERFMAFCSGDRVRLCDLSPSILRHAERPKVETPVLATVRDRTIQDIDDVSDSWIRSIAPESGPLGESRIRGEIVTIMDVLQQTGNNRTRAAQILGISREALYKKLRKYRLTDFHLV